MALNDDPKTAIARQFIAMIPHSTALGMELEEIGDGVAEISMPYDRRFVGDARTGVIHGGAVSALLDTCAGAAVISHRATPEMTATLDLRIDYMRPATPGQRIVARATPHSAESSSTVGICAPTAQVPASMRLRNRVASWM